MALFINRVGKTFGQFLVVKELPNSKVLARCTKCDVEDTYTKSKVVAGSCRCRHCKESKIEDISGQIANGLIAVRDTTRGFIEVRCLTCNSTDEKKKYSFKIGRVACKNCEEIKKQAYIGRIYRGLKIIKYTSSRIVEVECIHCEARSTRDKIQLERGKLTCSKCRTEYKQRDDSSKVGYVVNNIEIIEEIGQGEVIGKCLPCGNEQNYKKSNLIGGSYRCQECNSQTKDRTGETHHGFLITKELPKERVIAKHLECGKEAEYSKKALVRSHLHCKICNPMGIRDKTTGNIYGDLKVIEELGKGIIKAECIRCGNTDEYRKRQVKLGTSCRNCGLKVNYVGKIINGLEIMNLAYKGSNDEKYFKCKCIKCHKIYYLSREEVLTNKCCK